MSKLRMVGTFAIASAVALFFFLGMGNLKSFAGPNYQELALLTNVLHLVQQHYVDDVDEHTLIEAEYETGRGCLNIERNPSPVCYMLCTSYGPNRAVSEYAR